MTHTDRPIQGQSKVEGHLMQWQKECYEIYCPSVLSCHDLGPLAYSLLRMQSCRQTNTIREPPYD